MANPDVPQNQQDSASSKVWQIWAGVIVLLGCIATAAYAVVENFWG